MSTKEELQEQISQELLSNPENPISETDVTYLTLETIEALNQKYEADPSLYINLETLKNLPDDLAQKINKDLILHSIARVIDISQSFQEQFKTDPKRIPPEFLEKIKPLVVKKVNEKFKENPNAIINSDYVRLISEETLKEIKPPQTINPEIINLLNRPQLQSIHPSILADYLIDRLDLSKPLSKQPFSDKLNYFLVPKSHKEERNAVIRSIEKSFEAKLLQKVNTEFAQNPNIRLDSSYVIYIKLSTLENLHPDQIINPFILEHLSLQELAALPPKIIAHYIISRADISNPIEGKDIDMTTQIKLPNLNISTITKLPTNIEKFLKHNMKKLTEPLQKEFKEQALEKLKDKVNAQAESSFYQFINADYLNLLTSANMNNLANYLVNQTNLEYPFDQQYFSGRIKGITVESS